MAKGEKKNRVRSINGKELDEQGNKAWKNNL